MKMTEQLWLRLHENGSLAWVMQADDGRVPFPTVAGAPDARTLGRAQSIIVVVPSEQVVLLDTPVLSRHRNQLAKAIPFALEDRLASPVEDLHFALGTPVADVMPVAIVARATMRSWLILLAAQNIQPDVMISETLSLGASGQTTLAIEDERACLRHGMSQAGACDLAGLSAWLAALRVESAEVFDFRSASALELPIAVDQYHARQTDALAFFAAQSIGAPTFNLLQGEFAPQHRQMPAQRLWRLAGLSIAALLTLAFVYAFGDWLRLSHEAQRLDVALHAVLHESFPKYDKVAGDPRQLMQSELTRLHGDDAAVGVLHAFGAVAPILGKAPRIALTGLEYRNAILELSLRAPDVQALDLVREQLNNLAGFKAETLSATPDGTGDSVDGRIRLTAGKA